MSSSRQLLASGDENGNYSVAPVKKAQPASSSSNSAKSSCIKAPSLSSRIKVVLRIKKEEKSGANTLHIEKRSDGKDHVMVKQNVQHVFPVDKALDQDASQKDVYNAVIGDGIDLCLTGYHVSVFAYGQTGSGKTFSITGIEDQPGILPLFASNLFKKIAAENLESSVYVSLSFYEVYQEKVYDLLSSTRKALRLRGGSDNTYVENVIEVGVTNESEVENWRRAGLSRRATASTLMNELSSRSHTIVCLKVQREYEVSGQVVVSKCFFVDLAGSEKIPTAGGRRFVESTSINKSLLSLQRVVDARASNKDFVGYRDSVLTRLLKNCFDGNSVTTLLATVSPRECYSSDTLNTLRFASKAAQISQDPSVNEEVDGESVARLREQNSCYLQKIAEMSMQLLTLKQHSASAEKIKAPAVLELFQDESLNQWVKLENGVKFSFMKDELAEYLFNNKEWNLKALTDGVFVNGESLNAHNSMKLKHGDTISYYERKFCAVYLGEKCEPNTFANYDRAKLQYVMAVYEKQKAETTEQIITESDENVKIVRKELENEVSQLRKQMEALKEELKTKTGAEKTKMKKEYENVETQFSDAEEVKKNIAAAVFKQAEIIKEKKEVTEEEMVKHVIVKSKIEMMNSLLNRTGKSKIFEFRFHDLQAVKLFNKKNKIYAELDFEKFIEMYDHFADLYQSHKTPEEILNEFNLFLYSNSYVWKPVRAGVGSSLLQKAVYNTLQETARKRRSTYAEVSNGFASRRSVIADIIQKPSERPLTQPVDQLIQYLSLFALPHRAPDSEEELRTLSETSVLVSACVALRKNFEVFIAPENFMTASSLQKKASSVVGIYRSLGNLDTMAAVARLCYISPSLAESSVDYCAKEMIERVNRLRQLVESWIASVREGTLSKDHGKLIFLEIDRIIHSVGYLTYFIGKRVKISEADVNKQFMKGVMSAVNELTLEIPEMVQRRDRTTKEKLKKLAAKFVTEILKYANEPFNEAFIFEVVRRVILIKEQTLTLTEDRAGKMLDKIVDVITIIEEQFANFVKPKTVQLLKDGLTAWKELSNIESKPPRVRRARAHLS